ncbi:MAG: serpin family protein [Draconibacterium sp.]
MKLKPYTFLMIGCLLLCSFSQLNAQTSRDSKSLNSYSFDLYRHTKVKNENLFLSPFSTYYALLLAYEGSKSKTKREFEKVLYLKNSGSPRNDFLHNMEDNRDSCPGLTISNAIWVDKKLQIESGFREAVSNKYSADLKQIEFANKSSAVSVINRWVSEKTNHRISEIVNNSNITSDTKLLMANAVYFKGEWLSRFDKNKTVAATFFTSNENQSVVDFMKKVENLDYFENDAFQFVSKPYRDSDLSFCIILPKKLFGIEEIENKMDNDFLLKILTNSKNERVSLTIPKIKLDASYELSEALKKAGLTSAFSGDADFSGITPEKPLQLGQVLHKTWIELDEEKTEAAAATATTIFIRGTTPVPAKVFNADHPFVFFILENSTNAILFIGRYVMPVGETKMVKDKEALASNFENRKKQKYSIGNQNEPLILINKKVETPEDLGSLDPKEIESFSIVKDKNIEGAGKYVQRKYARGTYSGVIIVTLKKRE